MGLRELIVRKDLRNNLIFSIFIWSCSMFNFYLITFYLRYFPGSIFKNSIWFAASDFLSYFISGKILNKSNVKRTLFISYLTSGIGALLYLFLFWDIRLVPIFIILSRSGNSMAFNTLFIANNRLFPTKFVSSTYGIVNMISHFYAIGAPLLAEVSDPYPFTIFFMNCCIGAFCSFFLKEINKELKHSNSSLIISH